MSGDVWAEESEVCDHPDVHEVRGARRHALAQSETSQYLLTCSVIVKKHIALHITIVRRVSECRPPPIGYCPLYIFQSVFIILYNLMLEVCLLVCVWWCLEISSKCIVVCQSLVSLCLSLGHWISLLCVEKTNKQTKPHDWRLCVLFLSLGSLFIDMRREIDWLIETHIWCIRCKVLDILSALFIFFLQDLSVRSRECVQETIWVGQWEISSQV